MPDGGVPIPARAIALTEGAARRIVELAKEKGGEAVLRLAVLAGGCSGFQYDFSLDARHADDDIAVERNGAKLLVDEVSLGLLGGAEVDYVEELIGASFEVRNPNANASCGCGVSFSLE